jgi:hypothetical protein
VNSPPWLPALHDDAGDSGDAEKSPLAPAAVAAAITVIDRADDAGTEAVNVCFSEFRVVGRAVASQPSCGRFSLAQEGTAKRVSRLDQSPPNAFANFW